MCGQQMGNPRFPNPVPDVRPRPQRPDPEPIKGEKGDKGDKGDPGEPGKTPTAEEIASIIIQVLQSDPDRFRGPKGDKGDTPEIDYDRLTSEVINNLEPINVKFHDADSWEALGQDTRKAILAGQAVYPGGTMHVPPQAMAMFTNGSNGKAPKYEGTVAERLGTPMKLLNKTGKRK